MIIGIENEDKNEELIMEFSDETPIYTIFTYTAKGYLVLIMVSHKEEALKEEIYSKGYGDYIDYIVTFKDFAIPIYSINIAIIDPLGNRIKEAWDKKKMGKILPIRDMPEEKIKYTRILQ